MKEFSIIIPCYNCAATIGETLRSVLEQDFDDYEVILVNDGSTDDTLQIAQQIAEKSGDHIRIHTQNNAGVSMARNAGLRLSSGRYLLFLDGDDMLARGLLRCISKTMKEKKRDTLCFLYTHDEAALSPVSADEAVRDTEVSGLLKRLTYSKRDVLFCSFVYDADLLRKYDLWFVEGARYGEDWEFATKYLAHCKTAGILEKYGYYYRVVATSVTRTVGYSQTDAVDAAQRTHAYLQAIGHDFADDFGVYMYPRAVFSVAHKFGHARNKELYRWLHEKYDVRAVMKKMLLNPNVDIKSRTAAAAYLVSPYLFYLLSVY